MGLMTIVFVVFILAVALGMVLFMGGDPGSRKESGKIPGCPPGFHPSLAFMEKYGETGIAYDEAQKLLCILHQGDNQSRTVPPKDLLATAILEDGNVQANSVRTDDEGKTLLSNLLTDDRKAVFQEVPDSAGTTPVGIIKPTSQTIELKILINDQDNPVESINFLNMEAKKGGIIYNEARAQAKNWQDLLGFLMRQAGKTPLQPQAQSPPKDQPVALATNQTS